MPLPNKNSWQCGLPSVAIPGHAIAAVRALKSGLWVTAGGKGREIRPETMHSQASQLLRRNNRAKRKQAKAEARAQARSSTPLVRLLPSSAEDTAISKRIKFAPTASSGLYGAARVPVRVGGCSMRGADPPPPPPPPQDPQKTR